MVGMMDGEENLKMRGQAAIEPLSAAAGTLSMRGQAAIELPAATARTLSMRGQAAIGVALKKAATAGALSRGQAAMEYQSSQ